MSNDNDPLSVMRKAYKGRMSKAAIPKLPTRKLRVYAAVGYILGHPKKYLTDDLQPKEPYLHILNDLTGERLDDALVASRAAGLHSQVSHTKVMLTPPQGLDPAFNRKVSIGELEEINKLLGYIDQKDPYCRLRRLPPFERSLRVVSLPLSGTS